MKKLSLALLLFASTSALAANGSFTINGATKSRIVEASNTAILENYRAEGIKKVTAAMIEGEPMDFAVTSVAADTVQVDLGFAVDYVRRGTTIPDYCTIEATITKKGIRSDITISKTSCGSYD